MNYGPQLPVLPIGRALSCYLECDGVCVCQTAKYNTLRDSLKMALVLVPDVISIRLDIVNISKASRRIKVKLSLSLERIQ